MFTGSRAELPSRRASFSTQPISSCSDVCTLTSRFKRRKRRDKGVIDMGYAADRVDATGCARRTSNTDGGTSVLAILDARRRRRGGTPPRAVRAALRRPSWVGTVRDPRIRPREIQPEMPWPSGTMPLWAPTKAIPVVLDHRVPLWAPTMAVAGASDSEGHAPSDSPPTAACASADCAAIEDEEDELFQAAGDEEDELFQAAGETAAAEYISEQDVSFLRGTSLASTAVAASPPPPPSILFALSSSPSPVLPDEARQAAAMQAYRAQHDPPSGPAGHVLDEDVVALGDVETGGAEVVPSLSMLCPLLSSARLRF